MEEFDLPFRPPAFKVLRKVTWNQKAIPKNVVVQQVDTSKVIKFDYSPQSGDKAYKSVFKNIPEAELIREMEKMLLSPPRTSAKNHFKLTSGQIFQIKAKAQQQKSYQAAAKLRTKYWKTKFDNCVKNMPPEEFLDSQPHYEPQGFDVDIGRSTRILIQQVMSSLTSFMETPHKVEVSVNPIGGLVQQFESIMSDPINFILAFGGIATAVYYTRTGFSIMLLAGLIAYAFQKHRDQALEILSSYGLDGLTSFTTWLCSLVHRPDDSDDIRFVEPQGCMDDYVDPIADGIFSLLFAKVFHSSYKKQDMSSLNRELGAFGRTQQGVTDCVHWFMQKLQKFLDWMGNILEMEIAPLVSIADSDVTDWSKQIAALITEFDEGVTVNYNFFVKVSKLKHLGEQLLANTALGQRDRRNAIRLVLNKLQPLVDKCKANNVIHNGPRKSPFAILIGGSSQVGKSYSSIPFLHELIARVIDDKELESFKNNPNDYIYNRVWENDFWDADHAQFCIVYDDLGQSGNPVLTKQNEYMEIIRGVNTLNFPQTMAALVDKGSCNYMHQLLFGTTNRHKFSDIPAIVCHQAVSRRFKLSVWLAPRREYCVDPDVGISQRELDKSKCKGVFDEDVHEFFEWDFFKGELINGKPTMTYRQFIDRAVREYKMHSDKEELALGNMKSAIDKGIAMRNLKPQSGEKPPIRRNFTVSRAAKAVTVAGVSALGALAAGLASNYVPGGLQGIYRNMVFKYKEAVVKVDSVKPQSDVDDMVHMCTDEVVGFTPEERCVVNIELLAYAISKAHSMDIHLARLLAIKLDPDADLPVWVSANKDKIDGLVRAEQAQSMKITRTLMGKAIVKCGEAVDYMKQHPVITGIAAAVGVITPVILIATAIAGALYPTDILEQSKLAGIKSNKHKLRKTAKLTGRAGHLSVGHADYEFEPQASDIPAASLSTMQFMTKVRAKNVYLFKLGPKRQFCGSVLFVVDNIAVVPMHFVDYMLQLSSEGFYSDAKSPENAIILEKPFGSVSYEFKPSQLEIVCDDSVEGQTIQDFALIRFKPLHAHYDIRPYFIEPDNKIFDHNFNITLDVVRKGAVVSMVAKGSMGSVDYTDYSADHCITYSLRTVDGDCGAVCYLNDSTACKPIILGYHIAGAPGAYGISYFVSKSHLDKMLRYMEDLGESPEFDSALLCPQMLISVPVPEAPLPDLKHDVKLAVEELPKPHQARTTKLVKSAFYNKWGKSMTSPAKLQPFPRDGVIINPAQKAFENYGGGFKVYNEHLLNAVTTEYISFIHNVSDVPQPWKPRLWTFEEACAGIPGVQFCESIPRSTSPGYPMCLYTKKPGKMDFFGDGMEYTFDSDKCHELKLRVEEIISKARQGKRDKHIFMTFLKDERRKLEKVAEGATRMIAATDLAFLVTCRMYYGDFVRWFLSNRIKNGSAVGVNPYQEEWAILYRMLRSIGDKCLDGDYREFDKDKREHVQSKALDVMESYYTGCPEEDTDIRSVFAQEVLNPHYLLEGILWGVPGSTPSGSFFTTPGNTIENNLLLRYCLVAAMLPMDVRIATAEDYIKFVPYLSRDFKCIALGDDNIFSVAGVFADVKLAKFQEQMLLLGHVYTASDKSTSLNFKSLDECTFLKRGFYVTKKTVLAPLSMATIREMPYWTTKGAPPDNEYEVLCVALYELGLHSESVFNHFAPKLINTCYAVLGKYPPHTSYNDCRAKIRSMDAFF